jgi:hypothetical protein
MVGRKVVQDASSFGTASPPRRHVGIPVYRIGKKRSNQQHLAKGAGFKGGLDSEN